MPSHANASLPAPRGAAMTAAVSKAGAADEEEAEAEAKDPPAPLLPCPPAGASRCVKVSRNPNTSTLMSTGAAVVVEKAAANEGVDAEDAEEAEGPPAPPPQSPPAGAARGTSFFKVPARHLLRRLTSGSSTLSSSASLGKLPSLA